MLLGLGTVVPTEKPSALVLEHKNHIHSEESLWLASDALRKVRRKFISPALKV
jgi:hypothetical protein